MGTFENAFSDIWKDIDSKVNSASESWDVLKYNARKKINDITESWKRTFEKGKAYLKDWQEAVTKFVDNSIEAIDKKTDQAINLIAEQNERLQQAIDAGVIEIKEAVDWALLVIHEGVEYSLQKWQQSIDYVNWKIEYVNNVADEFSEKTIAFSKDVYEGTIEWAINTKNAVVETYDDVTDSIAEQSKRLQQAIEDGIITVEQTVDWAIVVVKDGIEYSLQKWQETIDYVDWKIQYVSGVVNDVNDRAKALTKAIYSNTIKWSVEWVIDVANKKYDKIVADYNKNLYSGDKMYAANADSTDIPETSTEKTKAPIEQTEVFDKEYTVRKWDTLSQIVLDNKWDSSYNSYLKEVMKKNKIKDEGKIYIWQVLILPKV